MQHPQREDWILYLFNEAPPEKFSGLREHLHTCEQCAAQLDDWSQTLALLDRCPAAASLPPARPWRSGLSRWVAAAAVLVIGLILGIVFERGSAASQSTATASMRAAVRAELQSQLARSWPGGTGAGGAANVLQDRWRQIVKSEAQETGVTLNRAAEARLEQLLGQFADFWLAAREQDRQSTLALIHELRDEQARKLLALRKDLETVASLTDDEIRLARQRLIQLSANLARQDSPTF